MSKNFALKISLKIRVKKIIALQFLDYLEAHEML